MPIKEVNATGIVKLCAKCDGESPIAFADVELGIAVGDEQFPDNIRLPPCASCGAEEILQVNYDALPADHAGNRFDAQRRAVNEVGVELRSKGRTNAACRDAIQAKGDPPERMAPSQRGKPIKAPATRSERAARRGNPNA